MIRLTDAPVMLRGGVPQLTTGLDAAASRNHTIAYTILNAHDSCQEAGRLSLRFDRLISHDITYVGIIQTAMASGLKQFPMPYVLTNCHNSLCAVGGTINEDDHAFGLAAAQKFGGIYVPANLAVIHQYAREELAACGRMILGSDSHTRFGPLGTMGVGEGGPELVKQLLGSTWDSTAPEVILVWLTGKPRPGVGPHDVAIALTGAVYGNGFVKNKVMEFAGPGVAGLSVDFRLGIDVMTTEAACLSSIWQTDEVIRDFYAVHGRPADYRELTPGEGARYDGLIEIDLDQIEPMAALPFHPSRAVALRELIANPGDILRQVERTAQEEFGARLDFRLTDKIRGGKLMVDQGIIAGCAGGMFENMAAASAILGEAGTGTGPFSLSVYPSSVPVNLELLGAGIAAKFMEAGVLMKSAFCGPCFGAGDVPSHNGLSIRHTTRNFPSREGSRPGDGQLASVILMDARSIAATARHQGVLTSALGLEYEDESSLPRSYDATPYRNRVYQGFGRPRPETILPYGPNIAPWPAIPSLADHLLLRLTAVIHDPVTTTDELIPSGETSSYRSNPMKLASFTLSRREPAYVGRCQAVQHLEKQRRSGEVPTEVNSVLERLGSQAADLSDTMIGSVLFCESPGDGSAREQAASCQRVLGGLANICRTYATKRYRSNCVNWGMLPFTIAPDTAFDYAPGDWVYVPGIREAVQSGADRVQGWVVTDADVQPMELLLTGFSPAERELVLAGCLMNWYAQNAAPAGGEKR
ncbi:hydratase [Proteiniclasticum sp. QWL-01]|uniref:hydratase n=1 Tax=Proteiniclasticum sp. QWL-01 TaxID=3036945 RepID=UPI0024113031|nr:hydratase [Proteiniclasticum sp. QWL-01]WFF73403.1 hydratase [Proteiniclasticum sp. QWL-01]